MVLPPSTPEEQGMDSARLALAIDYLRGQRDRYRIHSLSVVRHGYLVTDASFWPFQPGQLHHIASVTKTVTCALIGIAVEKGYIADVHDRVLSFFPDRSIANRTAWKEAMTIEHLLTMTSGLGGVLDYEAEEAAMMASPDWLQYCLDLPMTAEPGTAWRYSDPNAYLLSAIITQVTGMSAHDFARKHLLKPLGIARSIWPPSPQGISDGSGGLMLAPHDLARFGQLFLQEGAWRGLQVISREWVRASTRIGIAAYMWGAYPDFEGFFYCSGAKGQRVVVSPSNDLVVVFNGGGYSNAEVESVYLEALRSFIFPAVLANQPVPANPTASQQLSGAVQRAASPEGQPQPVPPPPPIAATISGRTYVIDANPLEIQTITLGFPSSDAARMRITASGYWTYDSDFEWAAGLDGIERFASGRMDVLAAGVGEWRDRTTFLMDVDELGNLELFRLTVVFLDGGERVSITIADPYPWNPDPTVLLTGRWQP